MEDPSAEQTAVGTSGVDVSVVLAVFNESGHLAKEVDRISAALAASRYSHEIILVDDGSTDGSLDELPIQENLRVIRFPNNRGSGSARRAGTAAAHGEVVVWTDVDMTYPNDQIPWLVDELDGYDQIVGARRTEEGTAKLLRGPAKWFIRKLASYLVRTPIPDLNSGFRAFRRQLAAPLLHLLPKGFSCVSTMTLTFLSNDYLVKYVPIDYAPREGESKFHWWSDTKAYFTQVVRMILSYDPLRVFGPLGIGLAAMGIGKLIFDWTTRDFRLATNTLLILMAAFQVLVIGLLADLVVRLAKSTRDSGS